MGDIQAARRKIAADRAAKQATSAAVLAARNEEYRAQLAEAGARGRAIHALSDEVEAARRKIAAEHAARHSISARAIAGQNREYRARLSLVEAGPTTHIEAT